MDNQTCTNRTQAIQPFTLAVANCRGNEQNVYYPLPVLVDSVEQLNKAAQQDHCCGKFRSNHRSKDDFEWTSAVMMDCDNDSDDPSKWKTPQDVQAAFQDVAFFVTYSRHHQMAKGSKAAKPRFHVYFALYKDVDTDPEVCRIKEQLRLVFPDFDSRAMDSARFFYGVENPRAEYYPGTICIDQWLEQHPGLLEEQPQSETMSASATSYTYSPSYSGRSVLDDIGSPISEGARNDTLHKFACSVLRRYGSTDGRARAAFEDRIRDCTGTPMKQSEFDTIWNSAVGWYERDVRSAPDYVAPEDFGKKTAAERRERSGGRKN